jgi:hypothetical protein
MKRIILACFLLTATCTLSSIQQASAQITASVTKANFTTKVNLMDTQIGAGNITAAQITWNQIHDWMKTILNDTKYAMAGATGATLTSYTTYQATQATLYKEIWALKSDLATNRVLIKTKLLDFANTIN